MADQVQVLGADRLASTMHRASDQLDHLDAAGQRSGDYVAQLARGKAPRVTGRLAGSVRAQASGTGASVTAGGPGVPYAGPIHWGWPARNISAQPFLTDALAQAEPVVSTIYADQVRATVATIHGK